MKVTDELVYLAELETDLPPKMLRAALTAALQDVPEPDTAYEEELIERLQGKDERIAELEAKLTEVRAACLYPNNLIARGPDPIYRLNAKVILDILDRK